ncbi:amino acid adenylation domain-containing protein [Nocardia brasiliensis]|uniref:Amino acid adenylation domain-containing protein n=1 Tax=Nocardia brasiliensis TaxID=37326 RepID=A0A6G9XTL5_NOCBR|nr:non-ribosomal peptide synthetase [Nocardia brasiliensis]QIS04248.1 amino acid adenylation domain-containing protein [Nocardia brasiliensis]
MSEDTFLPTRPRSLPEFVAVAAATYPDRTALICGDQRLSYRALTHRVAEFADLLHRHGVRPGMPVPVLLERGIELPVCLLGILAAGGVCVPLDPAHPAERTRFILADCGAEFLVTNVEVAELDSSGLRVIDIRDVVPPVNSPAPPVVADVGDPLAYYLYTSGSTGKPKGVMLTQRGVLNVLEWAGTYLDIGPADVVLQRTTFTFDISLLELFVPLLNGAAVVLLPPAAQRSPDVVRRAIIDHHVDIVQFTPSGLATHLATVDGEPLPGVTRCLVAGEPLKPALRDEFYAVTTDCTLYNLYGPTETTIYATATEVPRTGPITVGNPLPNTWIEIRDDDGIVCAPGVLGELWIGGTGVARGYLNKPELTGERFVAGAFRSGDLGVRLPNGEIDLRGRRDHQVKIRGFRIELGEIENALSNTAGVDDGVVTVVDLTGQPELAAYWVGACDARRLAENLRRTLPDYMIPTRYVPMDVFPLTGSGKIDRNALPMPSTESAPATRYVAPRDDTDARLCAIFQDSLGWARVGITDGFLDLGGDSLKAARVARRIRSELGCAVEVSRLLGNCSVELLADYLGTAGAERTEIAVAPAASSYPLTAGQQSLWLLEQAGAPHAAFVEPLVYRLTGDVDVDLLRDAVEHVLRRHEALRTAITTVDGLPRQHVVEDAELDWSAVAIDSDSECEAFLAEFVARDFDLTTGRLFRAAVIRRAPNTRIFAVAMHHIATDGWSLTVLINEIFSRYCESRAGKAPDPHRLSLQYKDFAVWQQSALDAPAAVAAKQYWLDKLSGEIDHLDLPTDRPRPAERTFRGMTVERTVPAAVAERLRTLCGTENATLFAGLITAMRVLFHRYTRQRDFAIGTSVLGRPLAELEQQVGYYVNAVALRDTVFPASSFRDLLRAAKTTIAEALQHGDYPFDRVVSDRGDVSNLDRNPFFDVMVMIDPGWGEPTTSLDGVEVARVVAPNAHSKLDLTLFLRDTPHGLAVLAEFSTEMFDVVRIERLLDHFETLLRGAVATPDVPVATLTMLSAAERHRLLTTFNDTAVDYGAPVPVQQLFERRARLFPDRIATVDQCGALTFAELDAQANAVAATLRRRHGVGRGDLVALLMDRSTAMVATILGVLKSGAAYLPLNTNDPAPRLRSLLDDSAARVLVVDDPTTASRLGAITAAVLDVRAPLDPDAGERQEVSPHDAAYCIYTSGSTGRPKGVLVEHGALFNRLSWMIDDLGLSDADVFLHKTPYVFDVSVWEILLPGVLGARQVVLAPGGEKDPAVIRAAIEENAVTVVHFVPSMLEQYLSAPVGAGFDGVRHCVTSGEALSDDLARRMRSVAESTELHNYYGPTEAAIDVSATKVDAARPVTIGRPAPNNRLFILDDNAELTPLGVAGELCIAGVQLARGYLGRPDLTARSFVANPYAPGESLYRTGDLARWTEHGEIVYLGRRDDQVKLRGLRVELGEIEHAIRRVPAVDAVVVLLERTAAGVAYLRAFVTGIAETEIDQVHAACVRQLPDHMVPTHIVPVDAIPVTANGKVDRRRLAAIESAPTPVRTAPESATELALLELWQPLLPTGAIGVTDDFFALGGNSLSALQLSSRISERFDIEVRLATIFKFRTIAAQAAHIDRFGGTAASAAGLLRRHPRRARHRLSYAQERMWFLQQLDPASAAYNIQLLARLSGPLDLDAFERAVAWLVRRHEILRTTYTSVGDEVFQQVRAQYPLPFTRYDRLGQDFSAVAREAREIAATPFDLAAAPPVRVVLFRVAPTEHHLLVVLHHVAGDGWSMQLLTRELATLYRHETGAAVALPAEPAWQYIDYAESQRAARDSDAIERDLDYWVARLAGTPPLELATDRHLDAAATAGRCFASISAETTAALRELATARAVTVFEVVVAAIDLVLSRLSGQDDVAVGFPVSSRQGPGLDSVAGLFLNTLVLRTDLSGELSFADLITRVSAGIREAYDHQSAPFELVVERLNPPRNVERTPIFDVLVNFQNDMRAELDIDGIDVEFRSDQFEVEAKFALSFYLFDDGTQLQLELAYRRDLFAAERAEAIVAQTSYVFDQVAGAPDRPLAEYSLCAPGLARANAEFAAALEAPTPPSLLDEISAQARLRPDQVAVSHGELTLTYQELDERTLCLAGHLAARGVAAGEIVAVTGPPGIGFVVALLATMRSGAAVFPLDPALPTARRTQLLSIARPSTVVAAGGGDIPEIPTVHRVDADSGLVADPEWAELPHIGSDTPAYLFFTSGTTGRPRGLLGRRSGLDHFLAWQRSTFGIGPDDRCAQLTSPSFDVMLRDTLLPLVSGATLVVPRRSDRYSGRSVFEWFERERITVAHTVPTVLQSWLLDVRTGTPLSALRWLFLAGEPLKAELIANFRSRCDSTVRFVNLYGPTETTLAKLAHVVDETTMPALVPVGTPLPHCQIAVLRDETECGVGEPGEVVIRTPLRTHGYYNEPDAAPAFVPNPRRADPDDLLYRTGDLGRLRPDGTLELIGRIDSQVKINGIRIQPAEVEAAVAGHALVETCLVRTDYLDGQPTLTAYVVAAAAAAELGDILRDYLTERLPSAMVPRAFVSIDRIPTTPNGKPDRAALPDPTANPAPRPHKQPRTATQQAIQDVWKEVLQQPDPGIRDNFFELGGTSLKLLRLYHLLDERFPGTFRVPHLFSHPTIAGQAEYLAPAAATTREPVEHDF